MMFAEKNKRKQSRRISDNPNLDLNVVNNMAGWLQEKSDRLTGQREDWWWTGKPPLAGVCPGVREDGKISSLPLLDLSKCSRQQVLDYFDNAWTLTEVLFSALQGEEAFCLPPYHQLRHPFIFYYVHPAAFYINKLCLAGIYKTPLNEYFEVLFEIGVDERSWDDMSKNEMEWPPFQEVWEYRKQVYQTVRHTIETHPGFDNRPITQDSPLWAVLMGIEHERLHVESASVLMREFPLSLLRRPQQWLDLHPSANAKKTLTFDPQPGVDYPNNEMLAIPEGTVRLGKSRDWPSYGWDNVYGSGQVQVGSFQASKYLISNGEFYQFVKVGGYSQQHYWTEEGWRWRLLRNPQWPTFWVADSPADSHQYKLRTCFEIIDMPWSWPVAVNYHEAKAYCNWRTELDGSQVPYRMMTEGEHNRMRDRNIAPTSQSANLNLAYPCEIPVDALLPNSQGFHDIFGNLWQWCQDKANPLAGFKTHYLYDNVSTPTFDGEHNMVMGCSFVSTGDATSIWGRFSMRPHLFHHVGFRLVRSHVSDSNRSEAN